MKATLPSPASLVISLLAILVTRPVGAEPKPFEDCQADAGRHCAGVTP